MPIRLRRSLFFVAPATPAGTPSRRQPGETVQALPGRSGRTGRTGCGLPGAPDLPKAAFLTTWGSEVRAGHETRNTNHGLYGRSLRRGCERVAQPETAARTAAPAAKSRLPCPLFPTIDCSLLLRIAQNCPELPGIARGVGGA